MARRPNPWYYTERDAWYVTINGKRHNLGPDKQQAYDKFYKLMQHPVRLVQVEAELVAAIFDNFLDWVERNRSIATYEWYRGRLQRFKDAYPELIISDLKPYHVEQWAGAAKHSVTTRRNNMRAVKSSLEWAVSQGHMERNPIKNLQIPSGTAREICQSPDEFARLKAFVANQDLFDLLSVLKLVADRKNRCEWKHAMSISTIVGGSSRSPNRKQRGAAEWCTFLKRRLK